MEVTYRPVGSSIESARRCEARLGVALSSISHLLITKLVNLASENGYSAIRIHPLDNMYAILTRKYDFVDEATEVVPFGVIKTPA
jgi:hypothetical protein